jgi:hypothetical protein
MKNDFTTTFVVDQSPKQVFEAVKNVRGWWQGFYSEQIAGKTGKLNDEFTFRAGDGAHSTTQKLVEIKPNEKLVWLVIKSSLTFLKESGEWTGTRLIFEITPKGNKTQVRFTHEGLVPSIECYDTCTSAWNMYIPEKLISLIQSNKSLKPLK